jgi:transposase
MTFLMTERRIIEWIRSKYQSLSKELSERARRRWAAVEAASLGWGGISAVSDATGIARTTIARGIRELESTSDGSEGRQRRAGAGRKRSDEVDPELITALDRIVEPESRGDPMTPLRWTCKSTRILAQVLTAQGHPVSASTVRRLLRNQGYSQLGMMPGTKAKSPFGIHITPSTGFTTFRSCENSAVGTCSTSNSLLRSGKRCRRGCSIRSAARK